MKRMNVEKYAPYPAVKMRTRSWPGKAITKAPVWCSVDLRDGNQALSVPMSLEEKLEFFSLLVSIGFKEIEVGFPSASKVEFDFVRTLIEDRIVPDDVTLQVLTQSREHLIRRTLEALEGAKHSIVHLYNSTSTAQREIVFGKSREEIKRIAVEGAKLIKTEKERTKNKGLRLQYSPESFTGTEPGYALEVCHAVMDVWKPTSRDRIIFNLPSTVEMSTPNVYADRIESFCRSVRDRRSVIVSVHTHNDRGTAVAAAELAVMAGADRVEGALFGNGERSGNMDVVTMALNLFSQGVDPGLDLSDVGRIRDVYARCTRMDVHPRHPYAGDLVYTAFSGSHQDAINKGMKAYARSHGRRWNVPYLPIDPKDVGRSYESIIRINSQSGKGGVAYLLERDFGIQLPKWLQPDFGAVVQAMTDSTGRELSSGEIYERFRKEYLDPRKPYRLGKCHIEVDDNERGKSWDSVSRVRAVISANGKNVEFAGSGNGPLDAFVKGFRQCMSRDFTLENYAEHAITKGADARAAAYIGIADAKGGKAFGAGMDENINIASIKAIVSALNRLG